MKGVCFYNPKVSMSSLERFGLNSLQQPEKCMEFEKFPPLNPIPNLHTCKTAITFPVNNFMFGTANVIPNFSESRG